MQADDLTREGARVLSVCNACRYCEQYCPAFQALEQRLEFATADLNYLANLCHGCGECLYACQYAPPHELAINVPQTFARLRVQSYEQYAWPAALGAAFRHQGAMMAVLLAGVMIALMLAATVALNGDALLDPGTAAEFYAVVPHGVLVALFGGAGLFVLAALTVGAARCARELGTMTEAAPEGERGGMGAALRDVLTLKHLHVAGQDCVTAHEVRTPWRRQLHHAAFYGFMLCFASTCVATLYHITWMPAPYAYSSLPVLLGTSGGIALLVGTAGLLLQRRRRDEALSDPAQQGLDVAFTVLLLLTAATGLLLLLLRHERAMGLLLVTHLGVVLALFVTLPYGKLVHGIYRGIALLHFRRQRGSPLNGSLRRRMEIPGSPNPYAAPLTDVREPEQVATERGRRIVLAVISTIVAFSVLPGVLSSALGSQGFSALTVARVVVSLVLCVFLYRRANWARVVGGSVLGLVGIGSILTGFVRTSMDPTSIALIVLGTVYVVVATVLLFTTAVRAYFEPEQNDARWFALVGLVFQCALIVGVLHFAVLAVLALQAITASGSSDPRILAEALGQAMIPLVLWGAAGVLGLSTTLATLMLSKYRARWFYRCSWAFGVLYLLFVPVGTLIGLVLITALVVKRREFPRARAGVA